MAQIGRMRVTWNGFNGSPGLNTFFFAGASTSSFTATDASNARTALETYFGAMKSQWINTMTVLVDSTADLLDPVSGIVQGSVSAGAATGISGTGGLSLGPRAASVCVSWGTGVTVGRRLLRGRTFLSPLINGAWGSDGSISATTLTNITNATNAFLADVNSQPVIWHRPVPLKTGNNGSYSPVVSFKINSNGATLRSRRS